MVIRLQHDVEMVLIHLVAPESGAIIHSANLASDCVASGWSVTYSPSGHQIAAGCKDYFLVLVAPDSGAVIYIYIFFFV